MSKKFLKIIDYIARILAVATFWTLYIGLAVYKYR